MEQKREQERDGKDRENTSKEEKGFTLVERKKRKVTFEKFVKVKEIFKRIENMSDKELEDMEKREKRFNGKMEKYVITARLKREHSTNNRNTNTLKIAK